MTDRRPLIGRDAERQRLGALVDAARSGRSAVLCLVGEPGVGKSALLDELVATAADADVLRASGTEAEVDLAFAGLSQLLGDRLHLLDDIAPPQAAALRGALALEASAAHDRFTAAAGVLSVLGAAAERRPVLIVIDDAHWIDRATAEALAFACRRLDADGVAVVVAARTLAGSPFEALPTLVVDGLNRAASGALLESRATAPVDPSVADRLHVETGGNALALVELATTMDSLQLAGRALLTDPLPVGDRLQAAFRGRLDRLPAATRRALVTMAADTGRSSRALATALDRAGVGVAALEPAERAGLVTMTDGRMAFRHPLMRSVCYQAALPAERRSAHDVLAGVEQDADVVAWHRAAAAVGADEHAAGLLVDVGRRARTRGAHREAGRAFEHAARLSDRSMVPSMVEAARSYQLAGELEAALAALDAAEARAAEPGQIAELQHLRATIEMWQGRPRRLRDLLLARAEPLEAEHPDAAARLYLDAIFPCVLAGEAPAALDPARRAARLVGEGHPLVELVVGMATTEERREREARPHLLRAGASLGGVDALEFQPFVALTAMALGVHRQLDLAHRLVDRLIAEAAARNMPGVLPFPLAVSSMLHHWSGSWREASVAGSEAVSLGEATNQATAPTLVLPMFVEASRGREAECRGLGKRAAAALDLIGDAGLRCWRHAALGRLELTLGRAEEAVRELEAALAARPPGGVPEWTADLVEAHDRSRGVEAGDEWLGRLRDWAEENDDGFGRALVAQAVMRRVDGTDLDRAYECGSAELDGLGDPFVRARFELTYGEELRREKRLTEARGHLGAARDAFIQLDAGPWAERALRELRAAGGGPRTSPPGSLAALTSQELRVALVIAEGTTNREASARLVLSPKTVAFHLNNVYRKLGIRSRAELTRLVTEAKAGTKTS